MTVTTRIIVAKMIAIVIVFFFNFWARKAVMFRHPS
jgi:putative flippase GtrA